MASIKYRHFTIEQLAEGVYAAIATPDGSAACNAGIVVLDDRTLVFDTFATIPAARELRSAAEALTGLPIAYVINSHDHPDHVHGNVVFAVDASLITANATRTVMAAMGLQRMDGFRNQILQSVRRLEDQLSQAEDAQERTRLAKELADGRAFLAGFPSPADYRLPNQSFADELTFHGSHRTARLLAYDGGHSGCDVVLHLPEESILFTGDLVTEGNLVFRYGNTERWLAVLDQLAALNPRVIVTGHGGILPAAAALSEARRYIERLLDIVRQAAAGGATAEFADQIPVPEGLAEYWFRDNVRFLIGRLVAGGPV
ncbi:MAG TPA: MBL fold metallo-hydrolase [Symbiobacteriaceae bacterium]|jgi:glyoxylase-like metal-dependent hydrolase (beta-lactamase superfamily II)